MTDFSERELRRLYLGEVWSVNNIAQKLNCSEHKVNYWLAKFEIPKRSISEAVYRRHNPGGDPFRFVKPKTIEQSFLYGLGIGLYWGEGTKASKTAVRLGNSDPQLVKAFIRFLERIYGIRREKLRFGLIIFSDMDEKRVRTYWQKTLGFSEKHFMKTTIKPARSGGTYTRKTEYGVLTVYFNNSKLQKEICDTIKAL